MPSAVAPLPDTLVELDAWLAAREAAAGDLTPGTEKHIDWLEGRRERRPLAVVYLHGFSASRQETHPLARDLAGELGANAFHTRLTGHGLDGAALGRATVENWLADGREALAIGERLGERVVVVACSTGATLVTALLARGEVAAAPLEAMIFLSPNFGLADRTAYTFNLPFGIGLRLARLIAGPELSFEPVNELHARYWTHRYPVEAAATMMRLLRLAWTGDPARVTVPVLTLYSPNDKVIDPGAIDRLVGRFPDPRNARVAVEDAADPSQHVIAGDALSPNTTAALVARIADFVRAVAAEPVPAR